MPSSDVPHLLKHCTLAIWRNGKISGGKQERFVSAWNIARSRLVEYGYLTKGSETGDTVRIHLTSKGVQRESFHAREPGGKTKSMLFDQMFRWVEVAQDTKKNDDTPSRAEVEAGEAQNVRRAQPFVGQAPKLGNVLGTKKSAAKTAQKKAKAAKSKLGGPFKAVPQLGKKKK